jgi:hypothetical protein
MKNKKQKYLILGILLAVIFCVAGVKINSSRGASTDSSCFQTCKARSDAPSDVDCNGECNTTTSTTATSKSTTTASSGGTVNFVNPLNFSTVEGLLGTILTAVQRIIVALALVFIVVGAIMIIVSAGNPETAEKGKKAITMALVGLAIGIAAPSILKELAGILGWGTTTDATVNAALSLSTIALRVLNFLLGITGVLAIIMLVIGAIMYLTSAGDEDRIDSGKKIFKYSLIGIVIVMSALVIVRQIAMFFAVG